MTNIWAQPFEEIRKPFFDLESLEEERAKKDYDGDGKIESGAKEYRGSVHNAIQKKKGLKPDGQDTSSVKEEIEEFEEGMTLADYKKKRSALKRSEKRAAEKTSPTRRAGIHNPEKKLERDARRDAAMGETGHGGPLRAKKVRKAKALGELGEAVESLFEVDRTQQAQKKIDVRKGIHNKVTINPEVGQKIREEVEEWIGELVEEGYDLSQFTLNEMVEIYESADLEEGTAGMPARGDAETVDVTQDKMLSAKRRAAQAQIRADLARVQLQKASMTRESFDSIVEYLSQRPNAFENLEEGVYDPKKSKLRPASERTKKVMTDAQRKAAKKEAERTAAIHSKGETVLAGLRSSGTKGKVKTTPTQKDAAPEANRKVKGRYDKLAKAASDVLKDIKK